MAKAYYHYVQRKKSESGQSSNVTYDLPEKGTVPYIVVRAFSTPTASSNPALPLNDAITKIEVIDGGTVIQSLSGNQLHGLSMIRGNPTRASTETNDNAVEGYDDFIIMLGGKFNGTNYAPNFSNFTNPQIRITWDYSLTTTEFGMSCDADTAPAMKFTVFCKVIPDGAGYTHGYVKSREIKTWTQATSTETKTEIPRDGNLVGIAIEAGYDALDWTEDVEQIKLSFNNGEWEPLHIYEEEIVKTQEEWFGRPFELTFWADMKSGVEVDVHMGYADQTTITPATHDAGHMYQFSNAHKGIETLNIQDSAAAEYATYAQVKFKSTGFMPYNIYYIPARALTDGKSDWIELNSYKRVDLFTTSGSSASTSSTPAIIAEYLITR